MSGTEEIFPTTLCYNNSPKMQKFTALEVVHALFYLPLIDQCHPLINLCHSNAEWIRRARYAMLAELY